MVTASMQDCSAFSASTWKLALAADTLEVLRPVDEELFIGRKGSTRPWSSTWSLGISLQQIVRRLFRDCQQDCR